VQLRDVFKSNLAIAPDGKHFAVMPAPEQTKSATRVAFLINFLDELKRRIP
jgi:hypothetical protein